MRQLVLLILVVLLSACAGRDWRKDNVALSGKVMAFRGNKVMGGTSGGSGFWVSEDIVATNAHVAVRMHKGMTGKDDEGNTYRFRDILGLDRYGDIAFLRAEKVNPGAGVKLLERPEDPRDLRGRRVKLLSNTGLVGTTQGSMYLYEGRVTNVIGKVGNEQVHHNADTAGGASGSAVFDMDTEEVLAINWGSSPRINTKLATAAWRVGKELEAAKARRGVPMKELFTTKNARKYFKPYVNRNICIPSKQKIVAPVNGTMEADMGMAFVASKSETLIGGIRGGGKLLWKGRVKGKEPMLLSLNGKGIFKLILMNPHAKQVCGRLILGHVAWEKGIQ